ncbi:hypothetical protein V865_000108 [Kwoniella europaea PYCC6329]|uniref:Uncharacterized protein n=1 Tax=Kwoniella europaea PYCC6329 TaxID=1423913 RepID=A0AAX4K8W2_9TREE
MARPFPFPDICLVPAHCLSVDDAGLRIKYEGTLSTDPSTTCPIQSVTLSSLGLYDTYRPCEYNPTSRYTNLEDWALLVGDSVSGPIGIPRKRRFQLWKGSLVQISGDTSAEPGSEHVDFIPLAEDGQAIRPEWLTIKESSTRTGNDLALTSYRATQETVLQAMMNTITRRYEIEQAVDTGINLTSQVPEGSSAYNLDKYTLNCSALIPENFSAYRGERAPIIILNSDFDLSATNPVADYRGPVRWITPNTDSSASTTRRQRFITRLSETEY